MTAVKNGTKAAIMTGGLRFKIIDTNDMSIKESSSRSANYIVDRFSVYI